MSLVLQTLQANPEAYHGRCEGFTAKEGIVEGNRSSRAHRISEGAYLLIVKPSPASAAGEAAQAAGIGRACLAQLICNCGGNGLHIF